MKRAEMAAEMAERAFEELRLRKEFGSARKQRPEQRNRREIEDAGATSADTVSDFEDDSEVAGEYPYDVVGDFCRASCYNRSVHSGSKD